MRTRTLSALLLLAACAASDTEHRSAADPPLIARELIARRVASIANDSFPLTTPIRIRLLGDTLVVADIGDDRIALFDRDLELLHVFGRSGAGPGELQGAFELVCADGLIAVGDMTNQRISFFTPDGQLVREIRLDEALRSFVVGPDGSVYHVSISGRDALFTVIAPDGTRRPWGTRPPGLRPGTDDGRRVIEQDEVLALRTPDGAVHVLDNREGVLIRFDSAGAVQHTVQLPRWLLEPIRKRHEALARSLARQGLHVYPGTIAKDLSLTSDGRLLLAVASGDVVAVVVDPATYSPREIRVPAGEGPWDAARRAVSLALHGDTLYAVTTDGLYAFVLEPAQAG